MYIIFILPDTKCSLQILVWTDGFHLSLRIAARPLPKYFVFLVTRPTPVLPFWQNHFWGVVLSFLIKHIITVTF